MKRLACVIVAATVVSLTAYGTSKATPIAPIPGAATTNGDNIIRAYYYHRHYYRHRHYGYYGHRYHHRYY
jgi:hypothetical protein